MFKIIKTKISGLEGSDKLGINNNYRTTVGYNAANKSITVSVDKVVRPDLTREETVECSFTNVDERTFTVADFPLLTDNCAWMVDFDVSTEKITNPLEVLEFTKTVYTGNNNFHQSMNNSIVSRYSENYLPIFIHKCFDKQSTDFEHSVLVIYYADTSLDATDTVITNNDAEDMQQDVYRSWIIDNIMPEFTFTIKDDSGNLVDSAVNKLNRNQYKVQLPSGIYNIDVTCNKATFSETSNSYDVNVVNGISNKNRLVVGDGTVSVNLNASGLSSGEYCKLKLNAGKFVSYAELWIDIE